MPISTLVLLRDSLNFIRNQCGKIVLLALWIAVITLCMLWFFNAVLPDNTVLSVQGQAKIFTVPLLINLVSAPLFSIAMLTLLQSSSTHQMITAWQALQRGSKHYIALLMIKIITVIPISFGLCALFIPGIWLALRWSLAPCILVNEQRYSLDVLTLSWRLTAPYWFNLLAGHLIVVGYSLPFWGLLWGLNGHLISNPWLQALLTYTLNYLTQGLLLTYCFRLYMQLPRTPMA